MVSFATLTLLRYRFRYTSKSRPASTAAAIPTMVLPRRLASNLSANSTIFPSSVSQHRYAAAERGQVARGGAAAVVQGLDVLDEVPDDHPGVVVRRVAGVDRHAGPRLRRVPERGLVRARRARVDRVLRPAAERELLPDVRVLVVAVERLVSVPDDPQRDDRIVHGGRVLEVP